ncbi:polysaccharide deacetylase family protein [Brucella sp. BE17]|uniref:polysaccharide deacetylase family protein n=1 Tax=Brucella sp. BE17 TaxID=3142977 RepID=UPI0031BA673E
MPKPITLTFDNGPDPEVTPLVLDVLARKNVKATFFVVGDKLRDPARRAVVRRAKEEGHWIGNHTFNHLVPLGLGKHEAASAFEIGKTQELIGDLSDERKFFRPFGGGGFLNHDLLDQNAVEYLKDGKFTCVLWNVVPRDWETPATWVEKALHMCEGKDHPLIVLHDLTTGAMARLAEFIDLARSAEMEFVQEFPEDCVPMVRGEIVAHMSAYVASETTGVAVASEGNQI